MDGRCPAEEVAGMGLQDRVEALAKGSCIPEPELPLWPVRASPFFQTQLKLSLL
jgi:hypothetical protein